MIDCQEQDGHCPHWGEGCDGCITIDSLADDNDDGDFLDDPNEDAGGEEIDTSFFNRCTLL